MQLTLRVQHGDGSSVDVTATTVDILDFEEHFGKSFLTAIADLSITEITYLGWRASRRAGTAGDDFRQWVETGIDVSFSAGEKAQGTPSPLEPTPST